VVIRKLETLISTVPNILRWRLVTGLKDPNNVNTTLVFVATEAEAISSGASERAFFGEGSSMSTLYLVPTKASPAPYFFFCVDALGRNSAQQASHGIPGAKSHGQEGPLPSFQRFCARFALNIK
jgi:hypothetical protein